MMYLYADTQTNSFAADKLLSEMKITAENDRLRLVVSSYKGDKHRHQ